MRRADQAVIPQKPKPACKGHRQKPWQGESVRKPASFDPLPEGKTASWHAGHGIGLLAEATQWQSDVPFITMWTLLGFA